MILIAYGFIYAFLGWIIEVLFYVYKTRKFVNRGFLHGPFVPIYGCSGMALHWILFTLFDGFSSLTVGNVIAAFLLIVILTTLLEFIAGIILYWLFETRWWDYSDEPFNVMGFIALKFSFIWGVLGSLVFFGIHLPFITVWVAAIPKHLFYAVIWSLVGLLTVDFLFTVKSLINFKSLLRELKQRTGSFDKVLEKWRSKMPSNLKAVVQKYRTSIASNESFRFIKIQLDQLKSSLIRLKDKTINHDFEQLRKISQRISESRLYKAFPYLKIPSLTSKEPDDHEK